MNVGLGSVVGNLDPIAGNDLDQKFSAIQAGWLVEHKLDGKHVEAADRVITPADFFANTAPTDLVVVPTKADQVFAWGVRGGAMRIQLVIRGVTITNTPTLLQVAIPDSWAARHSGVTMGWANDNGTQVPMLVGVATGSKTINMAKIPAAVWANTTGGTDFGFTWEFNVRRG